MTVHKTSVLDLYPSQVQPSNCDRSAAWSAFEKKLAPQFTSVHGHRRIAVVAVIPLIPGVVVLVAAPASDPGDGDRAVVVGSDAVDEHPASTIASGTSSNACRRERLVPANWLEGSTFMTLLATRALLPAHH